MGCGGGWDVCVCATRNSIGTLILSNLKPCGHLPEGKWTWRHLLGLCRHMLGENEGRGGRGRKRQGGGREKRKEGGGEVLANCCGPLHVMALRTECYPRFRNFGAGKKNAPKKVPDEWRMQSTPPPPPPPPLGAAYLP